jgi:hypothetical protein
MAMAIFCAAAVAWGSMQEQERDQEGVLVHEPERQEKSYSTQQKFPTIEPNFRHYIRLADQELGKIFRAKTQKTKLELEAQRTGAQ